jgi:hypothetical protein
MYMNTKIIKFALTLAAVIVSGSAAAYEDEKLEVLCKKPKFHDFSLPEYKEPEKIEVAPESEFEFKVSIWSDPKTVKLTGKKEKIPFTVESTTSFHRVKAKLPASLTGKFVRIDAGVKAELGCDEQEGWLVKVADKKPVADTSGPQPDATAPAPQQNAPAQKSGETAPQTVAPETQPAVPAAQ